MFQQDSGCATLYGWHVWCRCTCSRSRSETYRGLHEEVALATGLDAGWHQERVGEMEMNVTGKQERLTRWLSQRWHAQAAWGRCSASLVRVALIGGVGLTACRQQAQSSQHERRAAMQEHEQRVALEAAQVRREVETALASSRWSTEELSSALTADGGAAKKPSTQDGGIPMLLGALIEELQSVMAQGGDD